MFSLYSRNILRVLFSIVFLHAIISSFAFAASSSTPSESPSAEADLICHTDNPADCYPKVFSPTEEFQIIHDDQDLPPGLHVQLDIQTGQKQARLNIPTEEDPALKGLPVDRSIVVIDSEVTPDSPQIPPNAPAYEPIGVVKQPKEKNDGFFEALQSVKSHAENGQYARSDQLAQALEELEDISHDMYYGLQIAEDEEALQGLFCIVTSRDTEQATAQPLSERNDFLASSIIASAVQNNQPALRAIEKSWDNVMQSQCKHHTSSLKQTLYDQLVPSTEPSDMEALEADFMRLNLAVLDGLMKSSRIRDEFLEEGGMKSLLQILLTTGELWQPRRIKVARVVSDTFLDEDVGATLGVWPSQEVLEAAKCVKGQSDYLSDGCWEHHLEVIGQDPSNAEWSQSLLSRLRQRRPGVSRSSASSPRDEL